MRKQKFMEGVLAGDVFGNQYAGQVARVVFMSSHDGFWLLMVVPPIDNKEDASKTLKWRLDTQQAEIGEYMIYIPAVSDDESAILQIVRVGSGVVFLDRIGGRMIRSVVDIQGFNFKRLSKAIKGSF